MHFLLVYLLCIFPSFTHPEPRSPGSDTLVPQLCHLLVVWPWTSHLLHFSFLGRLMMGRSWPWQLCSFPLHLFSIKLFHWDQISQKGNRIQFIKIHVTQLFWNATIISQEVGHSEHGMVLLHHFLWMTTAPAHRKHWCIVLTGLRIIPKLSLTVHLLCAKNSSRLLAIFFQS